MSTDRTWQLLKGEQLKKETETIVCAAQEQALQVNLMKNHIHIHVSPMRKLCGESSETVMHPSSGRPVLAKSKYRI